MPGRPMTACGIVLSEQEPGAILVVDVLPSNGCTICTLRAEGLPPAITIPVATGPARGEG